MIGYCGCRFWSHHPRDTHTHTRTLDILYASLTCYNRPQARHLRYATRVDEVEKHNVPSLLSGKQRLLTGKSGVATSLCDHDSNTLKHLEDS